jgi:inner membrane protein
MTNSPNEAPSSSNSIESATVSDAAKDAAFWKPFLTSFKFAFIAILILVLLIPLSLVGGLVHERQQRNEEVKSEIAGNWGNKQYVLGPMFLLPYSENGAQKFVVFLPDELNIAGNLKPEARYRGIYKTTVYTSQLDIKGQLVLPSEAQIKSLTGKQASLDWNNAQIALGVADTKGIRSAVNMTLGGKTISFEPSSGFKGLRARLGKVTPGKNAFHLTMGLNGNQDIQFAPLGKSTQVSLASNWQNPSFIGGYLPTKRAIDAKGFNADWQASYFSRNIPQSFVLSSITDLRADYDKNLGTDFLLGYSGAGTDLFGVSLITPVDFYQQVERATKYGILFLTLTFLVYFLFEVIAKTKLHAFHYSLIGFALCLFYVLLLALSEVMSFCLAYGLASIGIIGLITFYSAGFVMNKKQLLIIPAVLTMLYVYLYVLLQLEDLSLLLGAIGLFIALGVLMGVTRKINWFNPKEVP